VSGEVPDNQAVYLYLKQYLQDEILVKVDRASMASSLEVRAPFLDYTLVEYICSLPPNFKLHYFSPKYLLKKLMAGKLPDEIINRKKKGFGIPLSKWLKTDLKVLMTDLLAKNKIDREGFFDSQYIENLMKEHLAGKVDNRKKLWSLMVFEMWFGKWS
jgi:asparagine synthase (glutamine-hydrolysing)